MILCFVLSDLIKLKDPAYAFTGALWDRVKEYKTQAPFKNLEPVNWASIKKVKEPKFKPLWVFQSVRTKQTRLDYAISRKWKKEKKQIQMLIT